LLLAVCAFARTSVGHVPHLQQIDDQIYRGNQPKDAEFAELARMGIKTVVDLRGGILHEPREKRLVEAAGMQYVSVRLSGFFPPKDRQIATILAVLEDPARGPVLVHCKRGGDRVGLVMACYRIAHDRWTSDRAYAEARGFGFSRWEPLMRKYIRGFDAKRVQ